MQWQGPQRQPRAGSNMCAMYGRTVWRAACDVCNGVQGLTGMLACARQVHYIWPNGQGALLAGVERLRPSYERLLTLLRSVPGSRPAAPGSTASTPFSRVRR